VPGIRVHATIEIARIDVAIAGVQSDVALGAFDRDTAVPSVDIYIAVNCLHANRAIASVNLYVAAQRLRLHPAVSRVDLQVRILEHADLDTRATSAAAPRKPPMTGNARIELHAVPVLAAI